MLSLQNQGSHNINLVTPTHFLVSIVEAIKLSRQGGLKIPIVYNTSGYERAETLREIDGLVDIYLVDMRYGDNKPAQKYSNAKDYVKYNQASLVEMHRQVGVLEMDEKGVAKKGVIVRHLVLPNGLAGTGKVMRFLAQEVSRDTYISLMRQYYPSHKARNYPELSRMITEEEYERAIQAMHDAGLHNGWIQGRTNIVDPGSE